MVRFDERTVRMVGYDDVKSIREIIDTAFGEDGNCPIDFNMLGSILYILARRLDLLKRQFRVELLDKLRARGRLQRVSTYMVSELKIHTKGMKRGPHVQSRSSKGKLSSKDYFDILPPDFPLPSSDVSLSEKRHPEKPERSTSQKRSGKHFDSSSTELFPSDEHFGDKSRDHKRSSDKYSENISPVYQRKTGKDDDEVSPAQRRRAGKYDDEMSLAERRRAAKYDDEMHPTERRRTSKYDDEMSPIERRRAEKYDDEMSPDERRRTGNFSQKSSPSGRNRVDDMSSSERDETRSGAKSTESMLIGKSETRKYRDLKSDVDDAIQRRGGKNVDRLAYDDADQVEQHEKIYIVSRTSSGRELRQLKSDLQPVVTQEQFKQLLDKIRALQVKFGMTKMLPKDLNDLRKPTSMTHPRTALNLSVRLDAAESRLAQMMKILTQLASQVPGIDLKAAFDNRLQTVGPPLAEISRAIIRDTQTKTQSNTEEEEETEEIQVKDFVTHAQLNAALRKLYDEATIDIPKHATKALAIIRLVDLNVAKTEKKTHNIATNFEDLPELQFAVEMFGERVINIDQRMSAETSLYQDNLNEMQGDLEIALDTMTEVLSTPQEDPAAVAQMSDSFKSIQVDFNRTKSKQIELHQDFIDYSKSLKKIMEDIGLLDIVKTSRDELVEALADKFSIADINGLLGRDEFTAMHLHVDGRLLQITHKIHSEENNWQKLIDLQYATQRTCADIVQAESLTESLRMYFEKMNNELNYMFDITGPLKVCLGSKKIDREGNCLSCGTPATAPNDYEVDTKLGKEILPKSTALESTKQIKEKKKRKRICVPGEPIPHPLDQDSFVCDHDCGNLVSINSNNLFGLVITDLSPAQTTRIGTPKGHQVEGHDKACLCVTCSNMKKVHTNTVVTFYKASRG